MIDHCTAFPDRLGSLDWSQCCAAHDLAYVGDVAKLAADIELANCVASVAGWPLGALMGAGVMLFGIPWWIVGRRKR